MLSMENSQTSLQVLEKLCVEYGNLSDIAACHWKNCVLSMKSSQTTLQVLEKLCAEYGKFSDITTGTGKPMS